MTEAILGLVRFNYKKRGPKWNDDYILDMGERTVTLFPSGLFEKCELVGTSEYGDNYLSKEKGLPKEFLWGHVVNIKYVLRDLKKFDTGKHYRMLGLVEDFLCLDGKMVGGFMPDKIGVASLEGGSFYTEVERKDLAQTLTMADELAHSFGLKHSLPTFCSSWHMGIPAKSLEHEDYCLMSLNSHEFCSTCQEKLKRFIKKRE